MLTIKDIIDKCNGKLISGNKNLEIKNLSKDTRTIKEGDIYIGIKGENFDGNTFYKDAFDKGAICVILDNINEEEIPKEYLKKTIIKVNDTIKTIQTLAKYKRSLYNIPVIGITGSVGKTSTKDIISSVLETKYKVLKTEGNNNNHIGLPLTILKLKDEDIMVLEMGMNHEKEISLLTEIAKPTLGIITNIGTSHIGNLGSRENILKAKLEITENLKGPLIINLDNDIIKENIDYIKSLTETITLSINEKSDYQAYDIKGTTFKIENTILNSQINNQAFIYNSLTAYIIGKLFNIEKEKIQEGINNAKLSSNRLEYIKYKTNITLINDTYNASLDSIKSSLELLKNEKGKRKIAIIGDILELGTYTNEIHKNIGEELLKQNLDYIVLIGENTKETLKYLKENNIKNITHFKKEEDTYYFIKKLIEKNDTVLFKASNKMNLTNIIKYLTNR